MFLKRVKPISLLAKLMLSYCVTLAFILVVITLYLYQPLKALLQHSMLYNQSIAISLTQTCIQKLFIGIWLAAAISIIASFVFTKRSLSYICNFSKDISDINAHSLDKRITLDDYPKELRQLANTSNQMLDRINQSFQQLNQFSASIAHELRNPVHCLQNVTEVALQKAMTIEEHERLLADNIEEYRQLTRLIDDLLFLSRNDHHLVPINKKHFNSQLLMDGLLDYFKLLADERLILFAQQGQIELWVDVRLFRRVLANLLDNAIKYAYEHSTITIDIYEKTHSSIICITNEGPGICSEHLPALFDGFYRAQSSDTESVNGLGLGLMIAKSIMNRHEGDITINSIESASTTVTLTLPKKKSPLKGDFHV